MATFEVRLLETGETLKVEEGTTFQEIVEKAEPFHQAPIIAAKFNNKIRELFRKINMNGDLRFVDLKEADGMRVYQRGLIFLLYMAMKDCFPEKRLLVMHSLGNALYCEVEEGSLSGEELSIVKQKMKELVEEDLPFEKVRMTRFEAIKLFKRLGWEDKAKLFRFRRKDTVDLYACGEYRNYFYGYLPPSTGHLKWFDLRQFDPGFLLVYPDFNKKDPMSYREMPKFANVFLEYKRWGSIVGVSTVGELNELIVSGSQNVNELILISEMLHEYKIALIAHEIVRRKGVRFILVAGPSSSGKTTFAKRLSLQLKALGVVTVPISLDDYFLDREKTPRDENGEYDFECIEAIDLELFNVHLSKLLKGEEIELPRYNFKLGKREWTGETFRLEPHEIVVIEGIHGLNERLTEAIPREYKFKVYVSALTQLSIDSLNRISTTDTRLVRRLVRDYYFRGHSPLTTLKMWSKVRRGEERNIFPFQEEADLFFNSALVYELAVLKTHAEPLLIQVEHTEEEYSEARRLLKFLEYFLPINDIRAVPHTSIIREFIGGSVFKY
ncbi:MAG: uridine kinase [Thermotogota bacterium]|nr:uridine kinase [Thermotogota bacterium]MDK2865483.1 uridine kinase [Thermotogota bacterium]HCZ05862.1 AAA family ATPase [Thermotogota bacterium]